LGFQNLKWVLRPARPRPIKGDLSPTGQDFT